MQQIVIKTKFVPPPVESSIYIGYNTIDELISVAAHFPIAIICDSRHLMSLQAQFSAMDSPPYFIPIEGGELSKTRQMKEWIEDRLIEFGCGGDTCIIGVGGGALLDTVGFVAATFCRSVRFYSVPTTLLAMVDAAIGGKNGVNVGCAKNYIGTLYFPEKIYIDIKFLESLAIREMQNGAVEMAKHLLLVGRPEVEKFQHSLSALIQKDKKTLTTAIYESIQIKMAIVKESEILPERRHLLNLGHTIGHAIEVLEHFSLSHGQAVAMGIIAECWLSYRLKMLSEEEYLFIEAFIRSIGLPLFLSQKYSVDAWTGAFKYDKKSKLCQPRFVLLQEIGKPLEKEGLFCHQIDNDMLCSLCEWVNDQFVQGQVL